MKTMQIRHLVIALALAAAAPFAIAAFQAGMTFEQAAAEVKLQLSNKATLAQVVANAQKAPLSAGMITTALIDAGVDPADAVAAMLRAGAPLQTVVDAALAAGASNGAIRQGALAANVSLNDVQAAIDSSPTTIAFSNQGTTPSGALGAGGGGGGSRQTTTTCTPVSASSC